MNEISKEYLVNEDGEIYSLYSRHGKRKKPLKMTPQLRKDGYYQIILKDCSGKKKSFLLHRLVAMKFLPNPNKLPEVNHIDGDKANNKKDNLEWVTRSENMKHRIAVLGYPAQPKKLVEHNDAESVMVECVETGKIFGSIHGAARYVGMDTRNIHQSLRTGCRCGGYHWKKCSINGGMLE